jgi:hypothetical protein
MLQIPGLGSVDFSCSNHSTVVILVGSKKKSEKDNIFETLRKTCFADVTNSRKEKAQNWIPDQNSCLG